MAEEEDTKPKLNISINYEGTSITVKVKKTMQFKKIFEAAEKRFGKDPGSLRFVFDGARVQPEDTPGERDMEDGDSIDAHLTQVGGSPSSQVS